MVDFFEYQCDSCNRPFCERIHLMNLALDRIEEECCLECLSKAEGLSPAEFYNWILEYVMARDCFKTPWNSFNASLCPRLADKSCFCKETP